MKKSFLIFELDYDWDPVTDEGFHKFVPPRPEFLSLIFESEEAALKEIEEHGWTGIDYVIVPIYRKNLGE